MNRRKPAKPKKTKAITAKRVQATEDEPVPEVGEVEAKPEVDEDPWGDDGLSLKQRRFCQYYVSEAAGNATKAAELAGYSTDNRLVLAATAWENLRKPHIRSFIGRLLARQGMTPDFLKSRLAELAQSSMDNFLTLGKDGRVETSLEQAAALGALGQVKEIREEVIKTGGEAVLVKRTLKLHDPSPALRTLAEMNGMLKPDGPEEKEPEFRLRTVRERNAQPADRN